MSSYKSLRFGVLALGLLTIPISAQTQVPGQGYLMATYYKVPTNQNVAFLELQQGLMKKLAQARIAAGQRKTWSLYTVLAGAVSSGEYNYVVIYSSDKPFDPQTNPAEAQKMLVEIGSERQYIGLLAYLQPLTTRIVLSRREVSVGGPPTRGSAMEVRRFKINPGKAARVMEIHRTTFVPVMQEIVRSGKFSNYTVTSPMYVGASSLDYDYSVSIGVPNFEAAMMDRGIPFREAFGKVFPNQDVNDTTKLLAEGRQLVRAELWRVIDSAH